MPRSTLEVASLTRAQVHVRRQMANDGRPSVGGAVDALSSRKPLTTRPFARRVGPHARIGRRDEHSGSTAARTGFSQADVDHGTPAVSDASNHVAAGRHRNGAEL